MAEVPAGAGLVEVRLFAGARAAAGTARTAVAADPADRLEAVLQRLAQAHPGLGAVLPACSFLLDGVAARPESPVAGASGLDVLPPFSGG